MLDLYFTEFALREAFSESDLPMRVDVVEAGDLPAEWNIRAWPTWHYSHRLRLLFSSAPENTNRMNSQMRP